MSKCRATLACVAAGSATGFGRSKLPATVPRSPLQGSGWGAIGPFGRGVAATPLLHTGNCGKSRDRGVATPWSATRGGVASAPLSTACVLDSTFRTCTLRHFVTKPCCSISLPLLAAHSTAIGDGIAVYLCLSTTPPEGSLQLVCDTQTHHISPLALLTSFLKISQC